MAKANLEDSRNGLLTAQREYDRTQELRASKIASEAELDASEATLNAQQAKVAVATAQVNQREAALRAAQVRLGYTRVSASWEGGGTRVVGERFVDEGAMLSSNAPIVSILDIAKLTGVVYVIDRDYARVSIGQDVTLTSDAAPGTTFAGRIIRIAPLLKEASRQARVEIDVTNRDATLKPGMFIRAQVEFASHDDVSIVPEAALSTRQDKQGVFLADRANDQAVFVPVTVGVTSRGNAEIVEPAGLSGEVVTLGQHLLEDGSAITIPETTSAAAPSAEAANSGQAS